MNASSFRASLRKWQPFPDDGTDWMPRLGCSVAELQKRIPKKDAGARYLGQQEEKV